ncbi:hypothetical protein ABID82_007247 [Methylobacterium sp. PvP062]|uniref:Transposase n=1 Tax=Methylobacterium radiotolerans TaxID=31998 RepID=A0ABV2N984_9HYPH|nr:hypothetical protein [Methylobacterium sp. PvP105]MBP2499917.1 hypothetical protein [Methylobacterium sp. PvP109]
MRFRLIDAAKKDFPVARQCKVLDVSPSGYFAWKNRPASARQREDFVLPCRGRTAFTLSHETHSSPRMTHELREQGVAAGRRRGPPAAALPADHGQWSHLSSRAQPADSDRSRPAFRFDVGHHSEMKAAIR